MDKISGILPASARVRGPVEAPPEAPAPSRSVQAPAAARAETVAQPQDKVTLSKLAEKARETGEAPSPEPEPPKTYKPSPESAKLKAIDELNNKFFSTPKNLARDTDLTHSEETLKSMDDVHDLAMGGPQVQPGSHGLRAS